MPIDLNSNIVLNSESAQLTERSLSKDENEILLEEGNHRFSMSFVRFLSKSSDAQQLTYARPRTVPVIVTMWTIISVPVSIAVNLMLHARSSENISCRGFRQEGKGAVLR